jgi:flagellar basal body-associated protein FliL
MKYLKRPRKGVSRITLIVLVIIIIIAIVAAYIFLSRTSILTTPTTSSKIYRVAYLSWDLSIGGGFFLNLNKKLKAVH